MPRRFYEVQESQNEKKAVGMWNRWKEIRFSKEEEEIEVEPYQDGYYFTLIIKENLKLSQYTQERAYFIARECYQRFSREKRPDWLKEYDPVLDKIRVKSYNGSWSIEYGWLFRDYSDKNLRKAVPEVFWDIFYQVGTTDPKTGITSYRHYVREEYRKLFRVKRDKRIITHRKLINGELESEKKHIDHILWDEGYFHQHHPKSQGKNDRDWLIAGKVMKNKVLLQDFEEEKRNAFRSD